MTFVAPDDGVGFSDIPTCIAHFKCGGMLLVLDDENRENEGDLFVAGSLVTTEQMALMIRKTTGILCAPMPESVADRLNLPHMCKNEDLRRTAFTVSCDARHGVTTGVSAADRVQTLHCLSDPLSKPGDLTRPGHIFPLRAREGGTLVRRGHTEASVDLCRFAGLVPVAVIGEVMNRDGTMARLLECSRFAKKHGVLLCNIESLVRYRMQLVEEGRDLEPL